MKPVSNHRLARCGIALVAAFAISGCRSSEVAPPGTPAELFSRYCAVCHGPGGNGAGSRSGPALDGRNFKYGRDFESIRHSVKAGRGNTMPGFADILSDDQINVLATHVLSLAK